MRQYLFIFICVMMWIMAGITLVKSQTPDPEDFEVVYIAEGVDTLPDAAQVAINQAVQRWSGSAPHSSTFYLIGLRHEQTWGIATLTFANLSAATLANSDTHLSPGNMIALFYVETSSGWRAALDTDPAVQVLLGAVPLSQFEQSIRDVIFPVTGEVLRRQERTDQRQQYENYKLPWPGGLPWARTRTGTGWHGETWGGRFPTNNSLDFDIINEPNSDIVAAAPGVVTHICLVAGQRQAGVIIQTSGTTESLGYLHLDSRTIPAGVIIGATIRQGDLLGRMVEGTVNEACGYSIGTHVHIFLPTRPFVMDGYTFSDTNTQGGVQLYSSQARVATLPPAPENRDLVRNGNFSGSLDNWSTRLNADARIASDGDSYLLLWGQSGLAGAIEQLLNANIPKDAVMEMSLELGNQTSVTKRIRVHLHHYDERAIWDDALICDFLLPGGSPLQNYVVRRKLATTWENTKVYIEVWPADNLPGVMIDRVQVRRYDTLPVQGTECHGPDEASAWDFTGSNGQQGWTVNDITKPNQHADGMIYTLAGDSPAVLSPALENVNADNLRYVYLETASSEVDCVSIRFQRPGERSFNTGQQVQTALNTGNSAQVVAVDMRASAQWAGLITRLTLNFGCDSNRAGGLTLSRVRFSNVPPELRVDAPVGQVILTAGNPTYEWPIWAQAYAYTLYIAPQNDPANYAFFGTVNADDVCQLDTCSFDPTTITDQSWLANGRYVTYLQALDSNGATGWAGPFSFEVSAPRSVRPVLNSVTGTALTSRPMFNWSLDDAGLVSWLRVYVAPEDDLGKAVIDSWYKRTMLCAEGESCRLPSDADMPNGRYNLYVQGWGAGGLTDWAGPLRFTLNSPEPGLIQGFQVNENPPQTILQWQHTPAVTWYEVWIGTVHPLETHTQEWLLAEDLNCQRFGLCSLTMTSTITRKSYSWYVRGWGAGGFTDGIDAGWNYAGAIDDG